MAWNRVGYERHIHGLWRNSQPERHRVDPGGAAAKGGSKLMQDVTSFLWPLFIVGRRRSDGTPFQGRFTPVKFALTAGVKLLQLPVRTRAMRAALARARASRYNRRGNRTDVERGLCKVRRATHSRGREGEALIEVGSMMMHPRGSTRSMRSSSSSTSA